MKTFEWSLSLLFFVCKYIYIHNIERERGREIYDDICATRCFQKTNNSLCRKKGYIKNIFKWCLDELKLHLFYCIYCIYFIYHPYPFPIPKRNKSSRTFNDFLRKTHRHGTQAMLQVAPQHLSTRCFLQGCFGGGNTSNWNGRWLTVPT